jgi:hypothetical protein
MNKVKVLVTVGWQKMLIEADIDVLEALTTAVPVSETYIKNTSVSYFSDDRIKVEVLTNRDLKKIITLAELEVMRAEDEERRAAEKEATRVEVVAELDEMVNDAVERLPGTPIGETGFEGDLTLEEAVAQQEEVLKQIQDVSTPEAVALMTAAVMSS